VLCIVVSDHTGKEATSTRPIAADALRATTEHEKQKNLPKITAKVYANVVMAISDLVDYSGQRSPGSESRASGGTTCRQPPWRTDGDHSVDFRMLLKQWGCPRCCENV
jgi:hypothetical protein